MPFNAMHLARSPLIGWKNWKAKGPTPTMKSRDGTEATDTLGMMNVGNHGNFDIHIVHLCTQDRM